MLQLLMTHSGKVTYLWNIFTNMEKFNLSDIDWHIGIEKLFLQAVSMWLFSLTGGGMLLQKCFTTEWFVISYRTIRHPIPFQEYTLPEVKWKCVGWPLSPLNPFDHNGQYEHKDSFDHFDHLAMKMSILCCWDDHHKISYQFNHFEHFYHHYDQYSCVRLPGIMFRCSDVRPPQITESDVRPP